MKGYITILPIIVAMFISSMVYAACGVPSGLNTTNITSTGATFTWSAVASATDYAVRYRVANPVGAWTTVTNITTTSYNVISLTKGTTYDWEVQTTNCGGPGSSGFTSATTFTTPDLVILGGDQTICSGASFTLISQLNDLPSGTNPYGCTYTWQRSTNGTSWSNLASSGSFLSVSSQTQSYYYRVITSACGGGNTAAEITSSSVHIIVNAQPTATIGQQDFTICSGSTSLTGSSSGGAGNCYLKWQWYNTTNSQWQTVGTGSSYSVSVSSYPSGGNFQLVDSCDGYGCQIVNSSPLHVTVAPQASLTVTSTPTDTIFCLGSVVSLDANLTGGGGCPITWSYGPDSTGWPASTSSNSTLSYIPNNAGDYRFRVSVACSGNGCNSPSSITRRIHVYPQPHASITQRNTTLCANDYLTFNESSTAALSPGCTRTWYIKQPGGTSYTSFGTGSSSNNYQFTTIGTYYVKEEVNCTSFNCQQAIDSVPVNVVSTTHLDSFSVNADGRTRNFSTRKNIWICKNSSFTLSANITGVSSSCYQYWYSPDINNYYYQTYYGFSYPYVVGNSVSNGDIYNYSTSTFGLSTFNAGDTIPLNIQYYCYGGTCSNIDDTFKLIVANSPIITLSSSLPGGSNVCASTPITLSATHTGGTLNCHYIWFKGHDPNNINDTVPLSNPNNDSVVVVSPSLNDLGALYFRVQLDCPDLLGNCNDPSATIGFNVYSPLVVHMQSPITDVCQGYTETFLAVGADTNLCHNGRKWKIRNLRTNQVDSSVSFSYTKTFSQIDSFRVVVTDSCPFSGNCNVGSDSVTVYVRSLPDVAIDGPDRTFCKGSNVLLTEHHSGGVFVPTIRWQLNRDTGWVNVTTFNGTAGSQFPYFNIDKTIQFRALMDPDGPGCTADTASVVTVTVISQPNVIIDTAILPKHVCTGYNEQVQLFPDSGINANQSQYIINWYRSTDSIVFIQDPTQHGNNYSDVVSPPKVYYFASMQAIAADSGCINDSSTAVKIIVDDSTRLSNPTASNDTVCPGGGSALQVVQTSGAPCTISWQYLSNPAAGTWTDIGIFGPSVSVTPNSTLSYRAQVNCMLYSCNAASSAPVTVNVVLPPEIHINPVTDSIICFDPSVQIPLTTLDIGGSGRSYQWQSSPDTANPITWTDIVGANANSVTVSPTTTTYYRILKICSAPGCSALVMDSIKIKVYPQPQVLAIDTPALLCTNDPARVLRVQHAGGGPEAYYIWLKTVNGVTDTFNAMGADTIFAFRSNDSVTYRAIMVSNYLGCHADTSFAPVTINAKYTPDIDRNTVLNNSQSILSIKCYLQDGGRMVFNNTASLSAGRTSFYSIDGGTDFQADSVFSHLPADTIHYKLVIMDTASQCNSDTLPIGITYKDTSFMQVKIDTIAYPFCDTVKAGRLSASVSGGVPPYSYHWVNVNTADSLSQVVNNLGPGIYTVYVTDTAGCTKADSSNLRLIPELKITLDSVYNLPCTGANNGVLTPIITGGTSPYDFTWFPSDSAHRHVTSIDNLDAGTYQVLVVDKHGCSRSATAVLVETDSFKINLSLDDSTKCSKLISGGSFIVLNNSQHLYLTGDTFSYLLFNAVGDTLYNYSGSSNLTARFDSIPINSNYNYLVIDETKTCRTSGSFFLNPRVGSALNPTFRVTPDDQTSATGTGVIKLVSSGTSQVNYKIYWSTGDSATNQISGLRFGEYVVTIITDSGQCVSVDTILVPLTLGIENQANTGSFMLPNQPNPFTESTKIIYQIAEHVPVNIAVFDEVGRQVAVLVNETQEPGIYNVEFSTGDLPSGIYYCSFKAGKAYMVNKMIILR